jgi:vacuolar-type H+-ATPase subunit C/Vma6
MHRVHFPSGRDFALARLGAARSGLLAPAGLHDLVTRSSPTERLAALRSTLWAKASEASSIEEAEAALEARAQREARAALADLDPGARRLVEAFLLPDDARALRGALRCVAGALSPERGALLLDPTPALGRERLVAIASCPDGAAATERLAAWGSPFAEALRTVSDLRKPAALAAVEVALDRAAWSGLRRAARGPGADRRALRALASARADLGAASSLLALASEPSRDAFPVEGGDRLDPHAISRISRLPSTEVPAALAAALGDLVGDPARAAHALGSPSLSDHLLGRALADFSRRAARRDPLTVAVPCAWLVEVGEELRRIRLALRATSEGFPPTTLLDLLEA